MTQEQVRLVQQSWELVKPIAKDAAHLFYDKLFTTAPNIRHLFKEDISEQSGKLAMMLNFVVGKLHRIDDIAGDVQKLGASHNKYGARPEHYDIVGSCLIATLKQGLGIHWNQELEKAWVAAFTILKNVMIEAQQAAAENTAKYKPVPSD
jgi:hemoglobin-like flavoprotein